MKDLGLTEQVPGVTVNENSYRNAGTDKSWVYNIKAIYDQATIEERDDGWTWYDRANKAARKLAEAYDVPLYCAAGVIAALSPNNKWTRNIADAETLIGAYLNGDHIESVRVSTYHAMRAKAWAVMELCTSHAEPCMTTADGYSEKEIGTDAVVRVLRGQKISSFFAGIMGCRDECTIDGHARNIAYGERLGLSGSKFTIGKREYAALQMAYAQAGRDLGGIPAYVLQAITWVTWRRIHGIA